MVRWRKSSARRVVSWMGTSWKCPSGSKPPSRIRAWKWAFEAECVWERLEAHHCCAGDPFSAGGGVELRDQGEDEAGDVAEEALVVAQEHAQRLGQREDELAVGQGEKQLLVEVLGEQEGAFLATGGAEAGRWPAQGMEPSAGEGAGVLFLCWNCLTPGTCNGFPRCRSPQRPYR